MCIRDRIDFDLNGEKHTLKVSETDADGNRYFMADNSDVVYPVSYTHLDVYKRQPLGYFRRGDRFGKKYSG